MSLNIKQSNFLTEIKQLAADMETLYGKCFNVYEDFQEDFQNGQDNALNTAEVAAVLENYGFDYDDIAAFCNQVAFNFVKFYTNQAVSTREYGKDIRKISGA